MLADRGYCYPLTVSDHHSRYLLACDALSSTKEAYAFTVFERAFKDFGLPRATRTDNGVPFASPNALYGLSRLGPLAPGASRAWPSGGSGSASRRSTTASGSYRS